MTSRYRLALEAVVVEKDVVTIATIAKADKEL